MGKPLSRAVSFPFLGTAEVQHTLEKPGTVEENMYKPQS